MHTKTRSEYKLGLGLDAISVHIICDRDRGDVRSIQRRDLSTEYISFSLSKTLYFRIAV
jgi:hypothetical protein